MPTLLSMLTTILMLFATLYVGRSVFGLQAHLEGYSFKEQATQHDNYAVMIRLVGMVIALFVAIFYPWNPSLGGFASVVHGAKLMFLSLVALLVSRWVNDKLILPNVDNNNAVTKERNIAVALVEAATYIATACVFAGSVHDSSHGIFYSLLWFVGSQAAFVLLGYIYSWYSKKFYNIDILGCVKDGNAAVAFVLGGYLLAAGIAIGAAIRPPASDFWYVDLLYTLLAIVIWFVIFAASQFVLSKVTASGYNVEQEIAEDGNWGIGLFYAAVSVAITVVFVSVHSYS